MVKASDKQVAPQMVIVDHQYKSESEKSCEAFCGIVTWKALYKSKSIYYLIAKNHSSERLTCNMR